MISIEIETKKGTLVKLDPEEMEEIYQAIKRLRENPLPVDPRQPLWPPYPPPGQWIRYVGTTAGGP